jgi:hypothetical protein
MPNDTPEQRRSGAPRREPSRFEPPPWEKEQFDQLSQERREREEAARLAEEAARAAESAARPSAAGASGGDGQALGVTAGSPGGAAQPPRANGAVAVDDAPVDPAQMEEMFQELSAEEGDGLGIAAERLRLGVGIALLVLGVLLALVSMRLLASSFQTGGPAVLVGSSIMGFMGVALAGAGLYLAVRSLRERGVM